VTGRPAPATDRTDHLHVIEPSGDGPRGDVLAATALGLAVTGKPGASGVLARLADHDRSALRRAAGRVPSLDVTDPATRRAAVDLLLAAALVAAEAIAGTG
jgi:hypothetical protein